LSTTSRSISLPEADPLFLDLRLADGLDPQQHFTRQKEISILNQGQAFTLHDIATAKFEACDSLTRVYNLYATLNHDPKLQEFAFLLTWPTLDAKEKRSLYSQYASHELSFFLFKKDPEFFRTVVTPYLANKKDKTFMDHFLLEEDLTVYLEPWRYGQLNIVERILLSRRIDGEQAATSRHVSDLYALLPRDIDRFNFLFDTAVSQNSLDTDDALGLKDAAKQLGENAAQLRGAMDQPMSAGFAGRAHRPEPSSAAAPAAPPAIELQKRQLASEKAKEMAEQETLARDGTAEYRKKADDKNAEMDVAEEKASNFFAMDADLRDNTRQLFRQLEETWEWAENNYHHLTIDQQNAELITVNAFWKDFAAHNPQTPFLSTNMAEASRNFPEIIFALAVLDLPFESPEHKSEFDGAEMTLIPGGPVVVYHEEIQSAAAPDGSTKVLVSQNFFKHGDRYRLENGEKVDKFVTEEFLTHTVYGCQVVITNPTSARQKLSVLVQIPQGAMPVLNSQVTKTQYIDLEPYHTQTVEYHFYFPGVGEFPQFPVHVARNGKLIANAAPVVLNVVDRPTKLDTGSWDYISQHGTLAQVVTFLETHNIDELNLDRIAWRMHDREAFHAVLPLLAGRHVYSHTLWSYSLLHNAPSSAREYLQHADAIVAECGGRLNCTLLVIDPVLRRTYQHLEYKPLVNARAHALGKRRQIVNERFGEQYHEFLEELSYERTLDDTDLLAVTYYLLLQDRVGEALETFARVNRANVPTQLQYDYCDAYLKFFSDDPQQARAIAAKYVDHPVDRWRNTFAVITAQLDEASGQHAAVIDEENRDQQQAGLAATEPGFDFKVESGKVAINYQNLEQLTVNFYQMDVELLFSRNPLVQEFGDDFASIKPNLSLNVKLPKDKIQTSIDLPAALQNSNVLVELVGAGQSRTQPYFSNSLLVQVIENYGQVQVIHSQTRKPVSKAYVKVYAVMTSGEVKFYKDGYTDLRGRFDYASLSTDDLDQAETFSILILSDEFGALVREATPPKQ
ncbi:MAG: hypothetical protein KDA90_19630, partial [Planctomycetaceae bacterium]|nr:hypothetical protein [Planctomycetaceae bacterium]